MTQLRTDASALRALSEGRIAGVREDERRVFEHYASLEHLGNRKLFERGDP